ncbi:DUF3386 family protein [Lignipirellula cremea]|uniref:Uncharacterized protein n=1 Tax=Lignipirellula cremea TaxID=2528010 RepID=A0A518DV31_9BACT|nr:hypothetical protein Pla8534_35120 [Lignipirellula cremea]
MCVCRELKLPAPAAETFAKAILNSIVGHRLDRRLDVGEPCAFVDEVTNHPLGRAVRVLKDGPGTNYRIRDKEVIQVNRTMGGVRYTHTILENEHNVDMKHLTVAYVADLWDAKTGALVRTDTNHQTWIRVGKFDLPEVVTRIRATPDHGLEVGTLKLSNLKLGVGLPKP